MKRLISLLIICTVIDVLQQIRPGAEWLLTGQNYSGLVWIDKVQSMPTLSEIQAGIVTCQANQSNLQQQAQSDIANIKTSTNTVQVRIQSLIDLLQLRGQL